MIVRIDGVVILFAGLRNGVVGGGGDCSIVLNLSPSITFLFSHFWSGRVATERDRDKRRVLKMNGLYIDDVDDSRVTSLASYAKPHYLLRGD